MHEEIEKAIDRLVESELTEKHRVAKRGDGWVILGPGDKVKSRHATKEKAGKALAALHIHCKESVRDRRRTRLTEKQWRFRCDVNSVMANAGDEPDLEKVRAGLMKELKDLKITVFSTRGGMVDPSEQDEIVGFIEDLEIADFETTDDVDNWLADFYDWADATGIWCGLPGSGPVSPKVAPEESRGRKAKKGRRRRNAVREAEGEEDYVITVEPKQPGKFEGSGSVGEWLHDKSMDGTDDELGDVEGFGWYGLLTFSKPVTVKEEGEEDWTFMAAILHENNEGFVDADTHDTEEEARKVWGELETEYEEFKNQAESEGV